MFGMSQDTILKMVSSLAKGYFDKNPNAELKISVTEVKNYIESNYKEFKVEAVNVDGDTKLILSKIKNKWKWQILILEFLRNLV